MSAAFEQLARDSPESDANVKFAIVQSLAPKPASRGGSGIGRSIRVDLETSLTRNESADAAAERLLLAALDDTDRRADMHIQWEEASMQDPRIRDMAAIALSKRWPETYPLTWSDEEAERDRRIADRKPAASDSENSPESP